MDASKNAARRIVGLIRNAFVAVGVGTVGIVAFQFFSLEERLIPILPPDIVAVFSADASGGKAESDNAGRNADELLVVTAESTNKVVEHDEHEITHEQQGEVRSHDDNSNEHDRHADGGDKRATKDDHTNHDQDGAHNEEETGHDHEGEHKVGDDGAHEDHGEEGHSDHGGGDDHSETDIVTLTAEKISLLGIELAEVRTRELDLEFELPGEIVLNANSVAHIFPTLPGIAAEVLKTLGDNIVAGDTLAIVNSTELADAKALYLAARSRVTLERTKYEREEQLWKKQISSEQEYLVARQALAEARINLQSARQKLRALGISDESIQAIPSAAAESFIRYEVLAPIAGTILEKDVTLGEKLEVDSKIFVIADLSDVWIMASVYEPDIPRVDLGQPATVTLDFYPNRTFEGEVTWIADTLDEATRTLKVRIEVDNADRLLKPGMFSKVRLGVQNSAETLAIPTSALLNQQGKSIVFVAKGNNQFERREVQIGSQTREIAEVRFGLASGESVITNGGFILKSELDKEGFEAGHGH